MERSVNVELRDTPLINPLFRSEAVTSKFLQFNSSSENSIKSCYKTIVSTKYNRPQLSKLLWDYNKTIVSDISSLDNCKLIERSDTTMVVTGQQAGMFTGPLYTIYKIITAINLAKLYSKYLGSPVIPVFWNATEDHDLSEISLFNYPGRQWKAAFAESGAAAERLRTSSAVRALIRNYLSTVSKVNHRDEIEELLSSPFENYGKYSSNIIAKLFYGTGLVILEPRILRKISRDFFRNAINQNQLINEQLHLASSELVGYNIDPSFAPSPDTTGLFYINESGVRNRILVRNRQFLVDKKWIEKAELSRLIDDYAERFSVSAYLRPVLQSIKLPNIAYVAGPGEYRYHLQLQRIYKLFNAVMPVIRLRNHATILAQKEQKLADRLQLTSGDYFKGPLAFYNSVELPEKYQAGFLDARKKLEDISHDLLHTVPDLMISQRVETFKTALLYQLEKLKSKSEKEYLRRCKVDNARVDRFFNTVLPKNLPQERIINVLYFIEVNGLDIIRDLINTLDPFEMNHYILFTKN